MLSPPRDCRLPCREPFQKGLTGISDMETQAPRNHNIPRQRGTQGQSQQVLPALLIPATETGHGPRPYTYFPALSSYARSESQWLSFALFPQLTWVSQSIQGPYKGCRGPFCLQPTCWIWTSQEESAPHLPLCSLQPREEYTDLD